MRRKVLLSFLLLLLGMFCFACSPKTETLLPIWDRMEIQPQDILSMELVYQGFAVRVRESVIEDFVRDLSASEPIELDDDHAYLPSEFLIRLTDKTGKTRDFQFFWFMGRDASKNQTVLSENGFTSFEYPMAEFVDKRFDLSINNKIYHFTFSGEYYWNEVFSQMAYETARQQTHSPSQAKLNGLDHSIAVWAGTGEPYYYQDVTWNDIIDQSEYVVIARYQGVVYSTHEEIYGFYEGALDWFTPVRWLKGNMNEPLLFWTDLPWINERGIGGSMTSILNPPFRTDCTYLLCASKSERDIFYYSSHERSTSAFIIDNEKCYTCYNSEYHLFQNVTIEMIEEYLERKGEFSDVDGKGAKTYIAETETQRTNTENLAAEWNGIVTNSPTVVIVRYLGTGLHYAMLQQDEFDITDLVKDLFSVRGVVKGEAKLLEVLRLQVLKRKEFKNGKIFLYDSVENILPYETGKEYVLFLLDSMDAEEIAKYALLKEGDILTPLLQNSNHPVKQMSLAELKQLLE